MANDFSHFQEAVESCIGQVLTEQAKEAALEFYNYYEVIKESIDGGKVGVNTDMLRASKFFPRLKQYNIWSGFSIILFLIALGLFFFNWKIAIVGIIVAQAIRFYSSRIKKKDSVAFAKNLIVSIHNDGQKGMANLCAHYIAGTIQLYSSSHVAHWPSYPSCVLGGPPRMIQ